MRWEDTGASGSKGKRKVMGKKFGRDNLDESFSFFIDEMASLDGASASEAEEMKQTILADGAIAPRLKLLGYLAEEDLLETLKAVQLAFYLGQNHPDFQFPDKA